MSSLCCGCPVAFCAALRLVASIALLASSSGAAIAARCPSAAPALPSAASARGGVAPLAAERSRPTAPSKMIAPLPCLWGASTGALLLAVVATVPGDLQGPRAGAHGCATFFSLVSLSSKPSLSRSLLVVLASRELGLTRCISTNSCPLRTNSLNSSAVAPHLQRSHLIQAVTAAAHYAIAAVPLAS